MNPYSFFILPKGGVVEKRSKRAKHLHDFCTKEKCDIRWRSCMTIRRGRGFPLSFRIVLDLQLTILHNPLTVSNNNIPCMIDRNDSKVLGLCVCPLSSKASCHVSIPFKIPTYVTTTSPSPQTSLQPRCSTDRRIIAPRVAACPSDHCY
jgi:hypothetical protein